EAYREAKLRLFDTLIGRGTTAVVNADAEEGNTFVFAALDSGAAVFTIGEGGAHIEIESVTPEGSGQRVTGKLLGEPLDVFIPLVGRFQAMNALMAAGLAMATGVAQEVAIGALANLKGAAGRLEFAG